MKNSTFQITRGGLNHGGSPLKVCTPRDEFACEERVAFAKLGNLQNTQPTHINPTCSAHQSRWKNKSYLSIALSRCCSICSLHTQIPLFTGHGAPLGCLTGRPTRSTLSSQTKTKQRKIRRVAGKKSLRHDFIFKRRFFWESDYSHAAPFKMY